MKNKIFALALAAMFAATLPLSAQNKKKAADTKDPVTASGVREWDVHGIKLIYRPSNNSVVNVKLFITGGVNNYNNDNQGIEQLMLDVITDGGSKKYPKEKYHEMLERKGISISGSAGFDYSSLSMQTLNINWDQSWELFQDVVLSPAWDQQSFTQAQQQLISGLQQAEANPDVRINDLVMAGLYKDKKYARKPQGTVETVENISLEDLKQHYEKVMLRSKVLLVVVGNVKFEDVLEKVKLSFITMTDGQGDSFQSNPVIINTSDVNVEPREIATNYIMGVFSAPAQGTREAIAMRMAMAMLSDRLFVEVRTKRNLSYAPNAHMSSLYDPYSSIYVSTTQPTEAVQVMTEEVKKAAKEGFKEKELQNQKETYLTSYYMAQETNGAQASMLGAAELMTDWSYAVTFNERVRSLTLEEVNETFKKYANAISWFYLGDPSMVDKKVYSMPLK